MTQIIIQYKNSDTLKDNSALEKGDYLDKITIYFKRDQIGVLGNVMNFFYKNYQKLKIISDSKYRKMWKIYLVVSERLSYL